MHAPRRPSSAAAPLRRAGWASVCRLDTRSLAAARIALGTILVADACLRAGSASATLAPEGMLPPDLARRFVGHPWSWSLLFLHDSVGWGRAGLLLEGIAGALLALGLATPIVTTLAWVAVVSVVRRTAPMTNAGDVFLACLLFWAQFLPWGAVWSLDARRGALPRPREITGPGAWALVLQVAAVYVSAGLGKWNEVWWSGDALAYALSVHDHGTPLGEAIAASGFPARLLAWATLALELLGPPLLAVPAARLPLVAAFVAFHAAIALSMDVCLFPWVGIAAWGAMLPETFWDRVWPPSGDAVAGTVTAPRTAIGSVACAGGLAVAAAAFFHGHGPWPDGSLPPVVRRAVQVTFLEQDWRVFGEIRRQRQWVYARAELADGDTVDLLRHGRPLETLLPEGGFHSIGDQRLQKLLWEIPKPDRRPFASHLVAVLARDWNRTHAPDRHVVSLELHGARRLDAPEAGLVQDVLLAAWPPRSPSGSGGLDRFLRESEAGPRAGVRPPAE